MSVVDSGRTPAQLVALADALGELPPDTRAAQLSQMIQSWMALRPLVTLYGLTEIQRDAGWYLARGALTALQVEQLPVVLDDLCTRIRPHVTTLLDGFQLSPRLLRAPIAADDYVAAFQAVAGAR